MKRHQQTNHALGSQAVLTLVTVDDTDTAPIYVKLWTIIEAFEQRFSRFRADSELSVLNANDGKKIPASPQLLALLRECAEMSTATNGLFNPFVLPALNKAGYIGSWPNPEAASSGFNYQNRTKSIPKARFETGDDWVRIPARTALDFGGIGKGYLLDELGVYLYEQGIFNFWLSLGGDILCAGYDLEAKPWSVAIQHATELNTIVDQIVNARGVTLGIATSGTTKRKGVHSGQAWHHIIDPGTSLPTTTSVLTATVTAESATQADVYAKCAVIAGALNAEQFFSNHAVESLHLQLISGDVKIYTK